MQVGAIFGLIFAILVMAFMIFFGSGMLEDFICVGNVGQTNHVIQNLEGLIDDIQASGSNSRKQFIMNIPRNAKVCFVDPENPGRNILGGWNPDPNLYIEEEIKAQGYNLWIEYNCGTNPPGHKLDYLVIDENFCVGSKEIILLTNIGIEVRVEKKAVQG